MSTPEEAQKEIEAAFKKETQWLLSLTPEDRIVYVNGVIQSLADSFREILNQKAKIKQAKTAEAVFKELNAKAPVIMPPIIYSIKPEFQRTYIKLLQEMAVEIEKAEKTKKA